MLDSKAELLRQLRFGAESRVSFQEARFQERQVEMPSRDALADELAAFANAEGGVWMLGVPFPVS